MAIFYCPNSFRGRFRRNRLTLVELPALILIGSLLISLLLPAAQLAWGAGNDSRVKRDRTPVVTPMHSLHELQNKLPPVNLGHRTRHGGLSFQTASHKRS